MNIMLPDNFLYKRKNVVKAYIKDTTLYIREPIQYKDLMYKLTYKIKFERKCCYCSHYLNRKQATIDHLYPQCMGGITIPDNMDISCGKCNVEKDNMNQEQFRQCKQTEEVRKNIFEAQEKIKREIGFDLPKEWVSNINLSKIKMTKNQRNEKIQKKTYDKIRRHYFIYENLLRPIIVDRNGIPLDGKEVYLFAKSESIKIIPAIILENVEVIYK